MNPRPVTAVVVLGFAAASLTACSGGGGPAPKSVAQKFLDAWARGDVAGAAGQTDAPSAARTALTQASRALSAGSATLVAGSVPDKGTRAAVPFAATWRLPGVAQPWKYRGSLSLVKAKVNGDDVWRVHWRPQDIHPKLSAGHELAVTRTQPDRAAILDRDGKPLFTRTPVVTVGLKPSAVTDLRGVANTLASTLHISASDIVSDVSKAKPDQFVPVITLRQPDYLRVRSVIHPLPGTVFQTGERLLGPTARFAQPFLGRVGDVTAELIEKSGGKYQEGDQVGLSGLQLALNSTLTGQAGVTIAVTASDTSGGGTDGTDSTDEVIGRIAPRPGTPVRTTLDRAVQQAADAAVASVSKNAAIVAIRPSTGEVLAVANGPNVTFDEALSAKVPAGSTFKIITATALLSSGVVKSDATVGCPGTTTVAGKTFHNENSFDLGQIPLREAFAHSCNTTFINLSGKLDGGVFARTAASFGIGAGWDLPVASFSGSVSPPTDAAERAADAIGQGRVLVSPLAMALVAATAQRGSTPTPMVITGTPAKPKNPPSPPPAQALGPLRDFMRAVVTDGTARGLAGLPGTPVSGKTGTAEFGNDKPPRAHAWFAGFRGDLAFAVFIEDGESSGTTAVPVAGTFLTALG
ncbi:MAG TPA: penicillin-binding transpeptidase domain-containing protein [Mycobacteriales bacterium]|nr:penicillin-binding transpeptidase domain-containing protein [Mycobacteriales bacterium]